MKSKMYLIQFLLVLVITIPTLFSSCQDDSFVQPNKADFFENSSIVPENNLELKKEFSKALAKVLAENKDAREFIKQEALKKIDNDYDVLYQLVKDQKLQNEITFEGLLSKYIKKEILTQIQEKLPTLTILVPELPENSFSAKTWDTTNDIPSVAIRVNNKNEVPFYNSNGEAFTLKGHEIPLFPVVVVKENERIIVNNNDTHSYPQLRAGSNGSPQFAFVDNIFDNTNKTNNILKAPPYEGISVDRNGRTTSYPVPENRRKILDAYDFYKESPGWHRDYIYYDLTPKNTVGPFKYNFKEHIVGFELMGDAQGCLTKISDQAKEPKRTNKVLTGNRGPYWTDGEFEFKVKTYVGNKSAFGNEIITYFRATPVDLFDFVIDRGPGGPGGTVGGGIITGITNRKYRFELPLPLFEWNLENYSANIKIGIEEVDETQTTKVAESSDAEFAANFGFSPIFEKIAKLGLEFGASVKQTRRVSYEVSTTNGNDELGEVIVNFWDAIIVSREITSYSEGTRQTGYKYEGLLDYNKKYYTHWYRLYIAPLQTN